MLERDTTGHSTGENSHANESVGGAPDLGEAIENVIHDHQPDDVPSLRDVKELDASFETPTQNHKPETITQGDEPEIATHESKKVETIENPN